MSIISRMSSAVCVGMLLVSGPGTAAAVKYGNLAVDPFIGFSSSYDSNIYLKDKDEKASLITTVSPGISFQLPLRRDYRFSLDYQAGIISYTENPSLNNAIHNSIDAAAAFRFPAGLTLSVRDNFLSTTDPATAEQTERVKRNQNTVAVTIGYAVDKRTSLSYGGSQVLHDYIQDGYKQSLSRRENEGNVELAYKYSPKLSLTADYAYGTVDYAYILSPAPDKSSTYNQVRIGARGRLTPKTTGEIKAGAKERRYNDRLLSGKDTATSVVSLGTITDFPARTRLTLGASRNLAESTFEANNYYTANILSFGLIRKFARHWQGTASGSYEFDAYPTVSPAIGEKREDSNMQGGLGLSYSALEWFTAGCGYTLRVRDSNIDTEDYTGHCVSVTAKLMF